MISMTYDQIQVWTEEKPVLYTEVGLNTVYKVLAKAHGVVFAEYQIHKDAPKVAGAFGNLYYQWIPYSLSPKNFTIPKFKWAAMDDNGDWFAFINKPSQLSGCWNTTDGLHIRISPPSQPFLGDWKDSLIEL